MMTTRTPNQPVAWHIRMTYPDGTTALLTAGTNDQTRRVARYSTRDAHEQVAACRANPSNTGFAFEMIRAN